MVKNETPLVVQTIIQFHTERLGEGGLCTAFLAVSLPVYEACFSLTVSGIKRANPSETSDESFKRNNERHTA